MWQLALLHVKQTNRKKIHDFAVPRTTNTNQIGTFVDQNVLLSQVYETTNLCLAIRLQ